VHAANGYYYRTLELDPKTRRRSRKVLERALRGGRSLTRAELAVVLRRARIATDGLRLTHLLADAELEGVVVSGPRRGKQFTYALLEERVPPAPKLTRDEALAELARRYFTSHGPATLRDYAWWSGLTVREAREGIDLAALEKEEVDGRTHWFGDGRDPSATRSPSAHLLPNFDEYLIAYKDRGPVVGDSGRDVFAHYVLVEGKLAGSWRRMARKETVDVEAVPYGRLSGDALRALAAAVDRYGRFLGLRGRLAMNKK
ncbi:MAG TPA: winged helix DNA-binding domain-containing protein, partial [Vicinamibacteria bacterium]